MQSRDTNITALVAGLLFVGLSLAYLVGAWTDLHLDGRWVLPLTLVGLGVAGLVASVRAQRSADDAHSAPPESPYR